MQIGFSIRQIFRAVTAANVKPPLYPPYMNPETRWYYDVYRQPSLFPDERPYYNPFDQRNARLGFRLIEFNMANSTRFPDSNFIELFDGNVYNFSQYRNLGRKIGPMPLRHSEDGERRAAGENDEDVWSKLYESVTDTLTIHLSASQAPIPEEFGFIAEIVTLPPAHILGVRDPFLNITGCEFHNNRRGALQVRKLNSLSSSSRNKRN